MKELTRWGNRTVTYNPLYEATLGSYSKSSYEQVINNLSAQWNISKYLLFKAHLGLHVSLVTVKIFLIPIQ